MTARESELRLVYLTDLRQQIDAEIAAQRRLRSSVVIAISEERARLARLLFLTRGARLSLGELVDTGTAPTPPATQEGHD